jgi:hypothetical protein
MRIYVCHSRHSNFLLELYDPIKSSPLATTHEFHFPYDNKEAKSKDVIKESNLLIAEVTLPGTGLGIEIGWADSFGVPILCISKKGSIISNSLAYVTNDFFDYADSHELIEKLTEFLSKK